jgi:hypothetical protein
MMLMCFDVMRIQVLTMAQTHSCALPVNLQNAHTHDVDVCVGVTRVQVPQRSRHIHVRFQSILNTVHTHDADVGVTLIRCDAYQGSRHILHPHDADVCWCDAQTGAYKGPDTFHRCLAARQLAWITQHLQHHPLPASTQQPRSSSSSSHQPQDQLQQQDQQLIGQLLPLLLAVTDDPSPSVQRYGQAALGWLGLTGLFSSSSSSSSGSDSVTASKAAASLAVLDSSPESQEDRHGAQRGIASQSQQQAAAQHMMMSGGGGLSRVRAASLVWHRVLLLDVARRLVVGCEEGSWATAMPAATSLVMVSALLLPDLVCALGGLRQTGCGLKSNSVLRLATATVEISSDYC